MRQFITFLLLGIAPCMLYAQDVTIQGPPPEYKRIENPNAPKFAFKDGDTYDFGKIPEGPVAEHVFEFTNTGKEPLIIQNVGASCGCTTPIWSRDPILPGHKGKITVRLNTAKRGNTPFIKDVYISSNAATEKDRYVLHIKGFITAPPENDSRPR